MFVGKWGDAGISKSVESPVKSIAPLLSLRVHYAQKRQISNRPFFVVLFLSAYHSQPRVVRLAFEVPVERGSVKF